MSYVQKQNDSDRLHIPHQLKDDSGNHYSLMLPFSSVALGSESRLELNSVPIWINDAALLFSQALVTGATLSGLVQTPFFIASQGIRLLYNDQTVYTLTADNAYSYPILNADNQGEVLKYLNLFNEGADPANKGVDQGNKAAGLRFIPLKPMVDAMLKNIGPLSSYPTGKWSIAVPFLGLSSIATGTASTTRTGGAVSNMSVLLTGHSENTQIAQKVAKSLAGDGIEFTFLQPVQFSGTYDASSTSASALLMNSLQGDLDCMTVMRRVTASLNSVVPNALCRTEWVNYPLAGDTISFGTVENPTYLFGKPLPQEAARLVYPGQHGVQYGSSYVSRGNASGASPKVINTGMSMINCSENASMSLEYGAYSGSIRVFNNWQCNQAFESTVSADTVTIIAYLRKKCILSYGGVSIVDA